MERITPRYIYAAMELLGMREGGRIPYRARTGRWLSPRQRSGILEAHHHGLRAVEIAERFGVSESTVYRLVREVKA